MIGPLEIAIVVVLILLFIGYRKLPELGRSAGSGLRKVKETASEKVGSGDEISTSLGRSAGRGMRDIRELRESLSTRAPEERGAADKRGARPRAARKLGSADEPESEKSAPDRGAAQASRLRAVRWIVDAMNVMAASPSRRAEWRDRDAAMAPAVQIGSSAGRRGPATTSRWSSSTAHHRRRPRRWSVAWAPKPRRDAADDEIVRMVRADPRPASIRVVTSDNLLTDLVHAAGATVEPAARFRDEIESG